MCNFFLIICQLFVAGEKKVAPTPEVLGITALSLGMIAVGSCNAEVTGTLLQVIMERTESELKDTYAKFLPLGLGLVYLARQEAAEAVIAALEVTKRNLVSHNCFVLQQIITIPNKLI